MAQHWPENTFLGLTMKFHYSLGILKRDFMVKPLFLWLVHFLVILGSFGKKLSIRIVTVKLSL